MNESGGRRAALHNFALEQTSRRRCVREVHSSLLSVCSLLSAWVVRPLGKRRGSRRERVPRLPCVLA